MLVTDYWCWQSGQFFSTSNLSMSCWWLTTDMHVGEFLVWWSQSFCAVDCRLYVAVRQNFSNLDTSSQVLFYQFHVSDWLLTYCRNFYTDQASGSVPWTADLMLQCGKISATGTCTTCPNFYSINFMVLTDYWYTYCRIAILTKLVALCRGLQTWCCSTANFSNRDMYNSSKLLFYQFHAIDRLLIYILQNFYTDQASGFSCAVDCRLDVAVRQISVTGTCTTRPNFYSINFMLLTDYWLIYILQNFYTDQA